MDKPIHGERCAKCGLLRRNHNRKGGKCPPDIDMKTSAYPRKPPVIGTGAHYWGIKHPWRRF